MCGCFRYFDISKKRSVTYVRLPNSGYTHLQFTGNGEPTSECLWPLAFFLSVYQMQLFSFDSSNFIPRLEMMDLCRCCSSSLLSRLLLYASVNNSRDQTTASCRRETMDATFRKYSDPLILQIDDDTVSANLPTMFPSFSLISVSTTMTIRCT